MSALLSVEEVHAVLEGAIVDARLANKEQAGEFARLLVPSVLSGVNELVGVKQVRVEAVQAAETAVESDLMSMSEALNIRNRVAEALQVDPVSGNWAGQAAEKLLVLGFIDMGKVKSTPEDDDSDLLSRPVSGAIRQQVMEAVSERTGMIPTVAPTSLSGLTD